MKLGEFTVEFVIGIAITFLLSFVLRKILPRFTKRSKTTFDDFVLNALADAIIPFGFIVSSLMFYALRPSRLSVPKYSIVKLRLNNNVVTSSVGEEGEVSELHRRAA